MDDMSGLLFVLCNGAAPFLHDLFRLLPGAEKRSIRRNVSFGFATINADLEFWILHLNADPYPAFHLNADPDPAFQLNVDLAFHLNADSDPDPAHLRSNRKLRLLTRHFSIVSDHGPPRLYFEPLKLLNFHFNADPDPAFYSNANPDPASKNNADPDPQL
jgi:hypothetical protein